MAHAPWWSTGACFDDRPVPGSPEHALSGTARTGRANMVRPIMIAFVVVVLLAPRALCQGRIADPNGSASATGAEQKPKSIQDFRGFIESVKSARFHDYRNTRIANSNEFAKMKHYILERYQGVEPSHSFSNEPRSNF
jgi:hypothetical protein